MRSFLAALRTLVLPYGRTTGARIILDGVNGIIRAFSGDGRSLEIDPAGAVGVTAFPVIKFYSDSDETKYALISGSAVGAPPGMFLWSAPFDIGGVDHRSELSLIAKDGGVELGIINSSGSSHGGHFRALHDRAYIGYDDSMFSDERLSVFSNRSEVTVPLYYKPSGGPNVSHPAIYTAGEVINDTSTANIAGVETITDTVTFEAMTGRTYEFEWSHTLAQPSAGTNPVVGDRWATRIREDNVLGTARALGRLFWEGAGNIAQRPTVIRGRWTAAATGPKTVVGTLVRESGAGDARRFGAADRPSILTVRDVTAT